MESVSSHSHAYDRPVWLESISFFVIFFSSVRQLVEKVVVPSINSSAGLALIVANLRSHGAEPATRLQ